MIDQGSVRRVRRGPGRYGNGVVVGRSSRWPALEPLRHRAFRLLVTGRFTSMVGNAVAPIALAFAVLDLTGSVAALGLVVGVRATTNVVFLLFGGVVADR